MATVATVTAMIYAIFNWIIGQKIAVFVCSTCGIGGFLFGNWKNPSVPPSFDTSLQERNTTNALFESCLANLNESENKVAALEIFANAVKEKCSAVSNVNSYEATSTTENTSSGSKGRHHLRPCHQRKKTLKNTSPNVGLEAKHQTSPWASNLRHTACQTSTLKPSTTCETRLIHCVLLGVFEPLILFAVHFLWNKLRQRAPQDTIKGRSASSPQPRQQRDNNRIQGDMKTLDKVTVRKLEKRACVVSFRSDTMEKYTAQIKTVLSQNEATKQVHVKKYLIGRHDDIFSLPPSQLYLVFVENNDKNVILEDPSKRKGDLKLTTMQAIKKMEADVILTYAGERESKSLNPGNLYNPDLVSVRQHPELCRLHDTQRMCSIFDKFSPEQQKHIQKVVTDKLS